METLIQSLKDNLELFATSVQEFITPDVILAMILCILSWSFFSWAGKKLLVYLAQKAVRPDDVIPKNFMENTVMALIAIIITGMLFSVSTEFSGLISEYQTAFSGVIQFLFYIFIFRFLYGLSNLIPILRVWRSGDARYIGVYIQEPARFAIIIFGSYLMLSSLNVDPLPMIASIGAISIGVGFAIKNTFENLFSFLNIIISNKAKIGQKISVSGFSGTVTGQTMSEVTIRSENDRIISIPNNVVSNSIVENHTQNEVQNVSVDIHLAHDTTVEEINEFESIFREEFPSLATDFTLYRMGISDVTDKSIVLSIKGSAKSDHYSNIDHVKNAIYCFAMDNLVSHLASEYNCLYEYEFDCECDCECDCDCEAICESILPPEGPLKDIDEEAQAIGETWLEASPEDIVIPIIEKFDHPLPKPEPVEEVEEDKEDENLMERLLGRMSDVKDSAKEYSINDLWNEFPFGNKNK